MERFDVLDELKRPRRKCEGFNNELNDFKRFVKDGDELDPSYQRFLRLILDNGEMDRDDNRKREDTTNSDEEEQPVRRNKILEIQVKVEGQKADMSNQVSKKRCERAHPYCNEANLPGVKEPSKGFPRSEVGTSKKKVPEKLSKKAGASKSVPRKLSAPSRPAQPGPKAKRQKPRGVIEDESVKKHKVLLRKVEEQAGTSNPVSEKLCERAPPSQLGKKFPEVIEIVDDDEDEVLGACGGQPGPKDKGKSVVSKIPEVEILGNVGFSKQGIVSPFVPSKRYHESLWIENAETRAFRNDVLKVLRKPFDLEEHNRLKAAIKAGSYLDHYKDLKRRLRSQYKREKHLAVLRGFFFWLQNLTREGVFRPWHDRVCLEVDPSDVGYTCMRRGITQKR